VRVTGGSAVRLLLKVPRNPDLRPTQDRVRESLFGMLAPRLPGARVLDLYSGTGAFAIEALSRGADHAVLVESNRACLAALGDNLTHTQVSDRARVVSGDVFHFLRESRETFDLIFADPPYQKSREPEPGHGHIFAAAARHLLPDGLFILEFFAPNPPPDPAPFSLTREKRYGNTGLWLLNLPQIAADPSA
jgi:16S rRNA (guanine(966)-N(2))-methyltransferase RsmD